MRSPDSRKWALTFIPSTSVPSFVSRSISLNRPSAVASIWQWSGSAEGSSSWIEFVSARPIVTTPPSNSKTRSSWSDPQMVSLGMVPSILESPPGKQKGEYGDEKSDRFRIDLLCCGKATMATSSADASEPAGPARLRHPALLNCVLGGVAGAALNLGVSCAAHRWKGWSPLLSVFLGTLANEIFHY